MPEDEDFADDDSEARRHLAEGRSIYYMEPTTPRDLVICEHPDGRREFIKVDPDGAFRDAGRA